MGFVNIDNNEQNNIASIVKVIREGYSFAVVSHISPDGDTVGSAEALCYALKSLNKQCVHVCDGKMSESLKHISELNKFVCEPESISGADVVIAVDCADESRLGKWEMPFKEAPVKIVIDHHATNKGFGDINYIVNYPACAQLMFYIIDELGVQLTPQIATCLYVAFLTDTGRFSYRGVNEATMQCVARLYACDLDFQYINRQIFSQRSFAKTKLLAKALANLEIWFNGCVSVIFMNYDEYSGLISDNCDTEGIVNYALDVEGCNIAIFAYEMEPNKTKVSLRSVSPEYDVSKIASHFGGGGHIQASGCTLLTDAQGAKKQMFNCFENIFYKF